MRELSGRLLWCVCFWPQLCCFSPTPLVKWLHPMTHLAGLNGLIRCHETASGLHHPFITDSYQSDDALQCVETQLLLQHYMFG